MATIKFPPGGPDSHISKCHKLITKVGNLTGRFATVTEGLEYLGCVEIPQLDNGILVERHGYYCPKCKQRLNFDCARPRSPIV